ncbi:MAG: hypothetical protein IJV97_04815 [Alphaproteobacteria bacterium]|nr:hypothetical protein [Alphaproteobacteria bacterium]
MNKIKAFIRGFIKLSTILIKKIWEIFRRYPKKIQIAILAGLALVILGISWFSAPLPIGKAVKEMEALAGNIRRLYQNRPDYWGLNTQLVLDKKIYPNKMGENNKLTSLLGNNVLVGDGHLGKVLMPGSRNFDITYSELTRKQCIQLATHDFDSSFWLVVMGVTIVNNEEQQLFSWEDKEYKLPISMAHAKKLCKDGSAIVWHND